MLVAPELRAAVDDHIQAIGERTYQVIDRPPVTSQAVAALLTAARHVLDSDDLDTTLAEHFKAAWSRQQSRAPWTTVFDRHRSSCSTRVREAAQPLAALYQQYWRMSAAADR